MIKKNMRYLIIPSCILVTGCSKDDIIIEDDILLEEDSFDYINEKNMNKEPLNAVDIIRKEYNYDFKINDNFIGESNSGGTYVHYKLTVKTSKTKSDLIQLGEKLIKAINEDYFGPNSANSFGEYKFTFYAPNEKHFSSFLSEEHPSESILIINYNNLNSINQEHLYDINLNNLPSKNEFYIASIYYDGYIKKLVGDERYTYVIETLKSTNPSLKSIQVDNIKEIVEKVSNYFNKRNPKFMEYS